MCHNKYIEDNCLVVHQSNDLFFVIVVTWCVALDKQDLAVKLWHMARAFLVELCG